MDFRIKSWYIFLSLQVGVMFAASGFITLALNMMIVNLKETSTDNRWTFNTWIYMFAIIMIITWIMAFMGAYLQESSLILCASIFWICFIVAWIYVGIVSNFTQKFGNMLCVDNRCAGSMWLYANNYYNTFYEKIDYFYHVPHEPANDIPIRDPFAYFDFSDMKDMDNIEIKTGFQRERHETKLVLASVFFIISTGSTLRTFYHNNSLFITNNIIFFTSCLIFFKWCIGIWCQPNLTTTV